MSDLWYNNTDMKAENAGTAQQTSGLTPREQEIFNLLLAGKAPKEIAYNLKISYSTFLTHQKKIYQKLGIHTINEFLTKCLPDKFDWKSPDVFSRVTVFRDKLGSKINLMIKTEKIDGHEVPCHYIKGSLADNPYVYAGIYIQPDSAELKVIKTTSSFSFNVLGDGNSYNAMLTTSDSRTIGEENHFRKTFKTNKNEISHITININELVQHEDFGKKVTFIQNNVEGIKFEISGYKGNFKLKIWDIKFSS
ncbi:MAG: helix-turn-helix transcriptional regulator [Treponema sp.]|nr:helix-turn-helix transcriptional regulator [Treponema sp.]